MSRVSDAPLLMVDTDNGMTGLKEGSIMFSKYQTYRGGDKMKKTLSIVITIIGIIFWSMGNSSAQVVSPDTCIHPETMNLNSKGNWVTAEIYIPGSSGVDIDSVRITRIEIPSQVIDEVVSIPRAPDSPWHICRDDGMMELKVKFSRYDKADPSNPQSLVGQLTSLLSGKPKGTYRTIVTITGELLNNEGSFTGIDHDFRVKKAKNGKK
jgi:hypothetical protein